MNFLLYVDEYQVLYFSLFLENTNKYQVQRLYLNIQTVWNKTTLSKATIIYNEPEILLAQSLTLWMAS